MDIVRQWRDRLLVRCAATTVVSILCAAVAVAVLNTTHRDAALAGDAPIASKEEAIARVERLGGEVRIDGEKPDQPVWAVDFKGCSLVNQDLQILASFPVLEVLNLADTAIDDEGLRYVVGLKRLKELDLSATKITDAGLSRLIELQELSTLGLNQTAITDDGLQRLAVLKKLTNPGVFDTQVTEAGLQRLDAAKREGAAAVDNQTAGIRSGGIVESPSNLRMKPSTESSD